jgi:hypothetical protein
LYKHATDTKPPAGLLLLPLAAAETAELAFEDDEEQEVGEEGRGERAREGAALRVATVTTGGKVTLASDTYQAILDGASSCIFDSEVAITFTLSLPSPSLFRCYPPSLFRCQVWSGNRRMLRPL